MSGNEKAAAPDGAVGAGFKNLNLESIGIALAITWFGALLWSPSAVPTYFLENGMDLQVHVLRLLFLLALCAVYLVVQFFPYIVHKRTLKIVAVSIGTAVSPLPMLGNVVPAFAEFCNAFSVLYYAFWAGAGFSTAVMMLIWGYDMSTKSNSQQGVVNIAASCIFSGAMYVLFAFMQRPAAAVLIMVLPLAMLTVWVMCLGRKDGLAVEEPEQVKNPTALTNMRKVLGKGSTVFIFSYGFIMGVAGSIGTQFSIMQYSYIFVGVSSITAGVGMYALLKSGRLRVGRSMFMGFLPFAVLCLFLFSIVNDGGKIALLFVIFFVVNSYNVMNTAYADSGKGDHEFNRTYDLFSCESRTADMVGSALGWLVGSVVQFVIDPRLGPYCFFLIAVLLVSISILSFFRTETELLQDAEPGKNYDAFRSVMGEWEEVCDRLSERYGLSARESEIFLLLSRGRDRQYIHAVLYIAPSTVRTHTYNLYQKMGIHSQQQLIDIVEAEFLKK